MADGVKDLVSPILRNFYEIWSADSSKMREVVFDNLETKVANLNSRIEISGEEPGTMADLRYKSNTYISTVTLRNHKFSFGGLSGGVAVKMNKNGEAEVVGIVTAERPIRLEYDKRGEVVDNSGQHPVADTIHVTPIESVKDLYEYARRMR